MNINNNVRQTNILSLSNNCSATTVLYYIILKYNKYMFKTR